MENEADKNIPVNFVCAAILSLYVFSLSVETYTNISSYCSYHHPFLHFQNWKLKLYLSFK